MSRLLARCLVGVRGDRRWVLQHDDSKVVTEVPVGDMSADLVEKRCQSVLDRAGTKRCARLE